MADYDSPWKEPLDRYFEAFLLFFFPQVHADIDWQRGYEMLDKELQKIVPAAEQGRRFVDKLVKVWLKSGAEQWLLIHVEVQTWKEDGFPERMHVYNYRLFDRYHHEVISLAILADDDPDWRPSSYGYGRWGFRTGTDFPMRKLLDWAPHWQTLEADSNQPHCTSWVRRNCREIQGKRSAPEKPPPLQRPYWVEKLRVSAN